MSVSSTRVNHDAAAHRFQVLDQPSAFLQYALANRFQLIHTEVPSELRGHGYGSDLALAALEYARRRPLHVDPMCPFVRVYLAQHPEYSTLVESNSLELKTPLR
jgi:uncharacterized protein